MYAWRGAPIRIVRIVSHVRSALLPLPAPTHFAPPPALPYIFLSFLSAMSVLSISDPSLLKLQLLTHQPAASSHTSTPDPHVPAMVSLRHNK